VSPIGLLIVDDHPVVRDGLREMFAGGEEFDVVGEAPDGAEAVCLAESLQPDVVLMDLRMPGLDGASAIRRLTQRGLLARVLGLTTYDTDAEWCQPSKPARRAICSRTRRARSCFAQFELVSGRVGAGAIGGDAPRHPFARGVPGGAQRPASSKC
jgi:DNA-binding NarL/FixJ family response regulator